MNNNTSPEHYKKGGLELIDIWKSKLTYEEFKGLCKGNVLKYVIRENYKNHLEDLEKAQVYLTWLIEIEKEKNNENSKHLSNK